MFESIDYFFAEIWGYREREKKEWIGLGVQLEQILVLQIFFDVVMKKQALVSSTADWVIVEEGIKSDGDLESFLKIYTWGCLSRFFLWGCEVTPALNSNRQISSCNIMYHGSIVGESQPWHYGQFGLDAFYFIFFAIYALLQYSVLSSIASEWYFYPVMATKYLLPLGKLRSKEVSLIQNH